MYILTYLILIVKEVVTWNLGITWLDMFEISLLVHFETVDQKWNFEQFQFETFKEDQKWNFEQIESRDHQFWREVRVGQNWNAKYFESKYLKTVRIGKPISCFRIKDTDIDFSSGL